MTNSIDDFDFAPVSGLDPAKIEQFARAVWPGAVGRKNILESWWMTTGAGVATAAVDRASGDIAGLCVGVPSAWDLDGRTVAAASICNWYVSPSYVGRGLGKKLVRSFLPRAPFLNTFSISEAAIENFRKLGWIGPYSSQLLLFPLPLVRGALRRRPAGYSLEAHRTHDATISPELATALDQIDRERPAGLFRQHRRASDWRAHLSYFPDRPYDFHIVRRDGRPIGYFALRRADRFAGRVYRRARLAYVSDVVLNNLEPETIGAFVDLIAAAPAARGAGALLLCTSDTRIATVAARRGWLSEKSLFIGPRLKKKAPLFMKGDGFKEGGGDGLALQLTFFDSDVDLNI